LLAAEPRGLNPIHLSARKIPLSIGPFRPLERRDPVHLIRMFGVCVNTATTYVHAAHPERCCAPAR
jgi:hypothetical protein